jgi:hypothetical protein
MPNPWGTWREIEIINLLLYHFVIIETFIYFKKYQLQIQRFEVTKDYKNKNKNKFNFYWNSN